MGLEEFIAEQQKKNCSSKKMKVTHSWGVYDAYKHIRKNQWYNIGRPLKEKEFYAIIRGINNLLAENIADGETVKFPCRMGLLELRKTEHGVSIVGGLLKNTYPIDWRKTLTLWYEDPEEYQKKTRIRREEPFVYRVKYCKKSANYENKTFYQFVLNKGIKKALKENIKSGKTDTLW